VPNGFARGNENAAHFDCKLLLEVAHLHFINDFGNENSSIVNKDIELPLLLIGRLNFCTR
jgi:hypothetical protein